MFTLTEVMIYAIATIGLDLVFGRAGQLSLAQATLFGVGAYLTALTAAQLAVGLQLVAVLAVSIVAGAVVAVPTLRLSGLRLALVTLLFGELVIFEDKVPRDGTAVCVIPTSVFQIDRDGSLAVLKRNEEARRHMFERLSRNIRKLEGQVEDFAFLDVTSRLAKYLVEVARLGRPLPLTQDDLAAAIGSTRMTVNKLLADFERRGLIDVERRNVRVIDEQSLQREIRV